MIDRVDMAILCQSWQRNLTLLDMAGGLSAPPFFKRQIVKKTLSAKNLKKFLSLLLDLFFVTFASIFIKTS